MPGGGVIDRHVLHYFQHKSVYALMDSLSEPRDWTIYVGLGATFDRTNVSWHGLVVSLFKEVGIGSADAAEWVERVGLIPAATALESIYRSKYETETQLRSHVQAHIFSRLYGPRAHLKGRLLERLAEFGYANAKGGASVVFVTPNYDDHLWGALAKQPVRGSETKRKTDPVLRENFSIDEDTPDLPADWQSKGEISSYNIHGLVSSSGSHQGMPVVGEVAYAETAKRTQARLKSLFRNRNVLIVGSSLSDGPLLNALLATKPKVDHKYIRLVIQPLQGKEWQIGAPERLDAVLDLNRARLDSLGLSNAMPDHFSQVGQLLSECSSAMFRSERRPLTLETNEHRYDNRLDKWWREWFSACNQNPVAQTEHHSWLAEAAAIVKAQIRAHSEEEIKVEVWNRWNPNTSRSLALWASSVGSWVAFDSIRKDSITLDSDYRAVSIFCSGTPQILHESMNTRNRWKSYFGVPIWIEEEPTGQLPVGVIVIASMWRGDKAEDGHPTGAISDSNLKRLNNAAAILTEIGSGILQYSMSAAERQRTGARLHREFSAALSRRPRVAP